MSPAGPAARPWAVRRPPRDGAPAAPTVVLVHGAMDRSTSFAPISRRLPDLDVIRYDRRGYGRSAHLAPTDLAGQVRDLAGLVPPTGALVVGHSMGALVALAGACAIGSVRGVVAIEPPMPWRSWWRRGSPGAATADDPAMVAERFLRAVLGDAAWEALPARTRAQRRSEGPALVADLSLARQGRPYRPDALVGRLVAVRGGRTDEVHRRAVATLLEEVPGAPEVVVDGAGHGLHLTHPDATAAAIAEAVAHLAAPPVPAAGAPPGTIRP